MRLKFVAFISLLLLRAKQITCINELHQNNDENVHRFAIRKEKKIT